MKPGLVQLARHGVRDHVRQIKRRAQLATRRDDCARDAFGHCMRLTAPVANHPRQRRLIGRGEPVGGGNTALIVHTHIERPFLAKRKTARCLIQLRRRHAQIEQNAVQARRAYRRERRLHTGKRTAREKKARVVNSGRRFRRLRVAVKRIQAPCPAQSGKNGAAVPTAAKSAVEIGTIRANGERLHRLVQENRDVSAHIAKLSSAPLRSSPSARNASASSALMASQAS